MYHGNIFSTTVFVTREENLKLGGCGMAAGGNLKMGKMDDMYMLGCILYSLVSLKKSPVTSVSHIPSYVSIVNSSNMAPQFDFDSIPKIYSKALIRMLKDMLNPV
jgi:hypothetical protein